MATALSLVSRASEKTIFVLGASEILASSVGLTHIFGQLDQLFDHLGGLDSSVLVAAQGAFQHLGERSGLHDVLAKSGRRNGIHSVLAGPVRTGWHGG